MSCLPVFAINCPNGVLSNYTILGNSVQNGTPTLSSPLDVVSVGDLITDSSDPNYGKYKIPVVVGSNCGVVDLGTLNWSAYGSSGKVFVAGSQTTGFSKKVGYDNLYVADSKWNYSRTAWETKINFTYSGHPTLSTVYFVAEGYSDAAAFKQAMSGKYLYYQRSTDGSWTAPTVTYIYANAPLRKVGSYADVLNSNGTITRNVGVKVLDGTETITPYSSEINYVFAISGFSAVTTATNAVLCSHFQPSNGTTIGRTQDLACFIRGGGHDLFVRYNAYAGNTQGFIDYLAAQYSAGTPVIVYYPLATATTESISLPSISMNNGDNIVTIGTSVAPSGTNVWPSSLSCILASAGIKVATTKYVATAFADSASELNATMGTIKNVVDNTIIQADRIGKLHTGKQNRPAENCPDGAQCLLITEADGSLHWYPICDENGNIGTQSSN